MFSGGQLWFYRYNERLITHTNRFLNKQDWLIGIVTHGFHFKLTHQYHYGLLGFSSIFNLGNIMEPDKVVGMHFLFYIYIYILQKIFSNNLIKVYIYNLVKTLTSFSLNSLF